MSRKTLRELAVTIALILAAFLVWAKIAAAERSRLKPPKSATLQSFAASMPPPKRLAIVEESGSAKIVWVGETALVSLASGPACYVFDAQGKLIQWNVTTGDGEPTTKILVQAYQQPSLTLEEALSFVRTQ